MSEQTASTRASAGDPDPGSFGGWNRARRFRLYAWLGAALVLAAGVWLVAYLQPHRWYTYTDVVSFSRVASDVRVGYVLWEKAEAVSAGLLPDDIVSEPALSSDGVRMVYAREGKDASEDLFLRHWDGTRWSGPLPMRALNSNFEETSPSLSGDGKFLYFASDRPGGRGGYDIWVARWDGIEYAWPLPLTNRVNTRFNELGPSISPDGFELFFSSNRPRGRIDEALLASSRAEVERLATDHDLYRADIASERPYEVLVEHRLSILYSLREGALGDTTVMAKLGGTEQTETAVDRALEFLAGVQSEDGRWDLSEHGGASKHDMAATGIALLAFYGRGERHDEACQYRQVVQKGMQWLVDQQDKSDGDLRGTKPRGDMYDHGIASLALVEAYGVTEDGELRARAQSAINFIAAAQHEEGGWRYQPGQRGDLSVSGWIIMALASAQMSDLKVDAATLDGAGRFLTAVSSGKDGGVGARAGPGGGRPALGSGL